MQQPRILIFTWHSRKNLELVLPLATFLRDRCNASIEFITSDTSGKMLLGFEGFPASTVNELILAYRDEDDPDPGAYEDRLGRLDLKVDWLWTPPDPIAPEVGMSRASEAYRRWKVTQFLRSYDAFLRELQPQLVMTWNGTLAVTRCLTACAHQRDIPCFFLERGLIPGTLVVDREGVNYDSALAGPLAPGQGPGAKRREALARLCLELGGNAQSIVNAGAHVDAAELRRHFDIPDEVSVILLPLQIENDTNIVENSPIVDSMLALIAAVDEAVRDLPVCVIVKPHPEDARRREDIERACGGAQVRCSWDYSLHSLLAVTDLALVINSTVGLEALLQNIPVLTLGNSIYSEKGFTTDVRNFADLRRGIEQEKPLPHELGDFWRFLDQLLSTALFSYDTTDPWGNREHLATQAAALIAQSGADRPAPRAEGAMHSRLTVRDVLSGRDQRQVVILGGMEEPFRSIPDHVTQIRDARDAATWFTRFQRPDLLLALQPEASVMKTVLLRCLLAREVVEIH